MKQNGKQLTCQ